MNKKQRDVVREAYETVPFYIRNSEQKGIYIEEILERDCWEEIPVLERNQIISEGTSVMAPSSVLLLIADKLIFARTSGSTGKYKMDCWIWVMDF